MDFKGQLNRKFNRKERKNKMQTYLLVFNDSTVSEVKELTRNIIEQWKDRKIYTILKLSKNGEAKILERVLELKTQDDSDYIHEENYECKCDWQHLHEIKKGK
jgi:hypothetical protein